MTNKELIMALLQFPLDSTVDLDLTKVLPRTTDFASIDEVKVARTYGDLVTEITIYAK